MQYVLLPTDFLLYLLIISLISFAIWSHKHEHLRAPWRYVLHNRIGMTSLVILLSFMVVGLLDSVHFRLALPKQTANEKTYYSSQVTSLLDLITAPLASEDEQTYSAPFATHLYGKTAGARLNFGGEHLKNLADKDRDILIRIMTGLLCGIVFWLMIIALWIKFLSYRHKTTFKDYFVKVLKGKTAIVWREIFITLSVIICLIFICIALARNYHILGTDKIGKDIFYEAFKSIRTGLIIGTLTTLVMLPFAIILGTMAGFFGGWLDDIIQYIYTTLSSIPGVLLITAAILALQIYIENHPQLFPTLALRADIRLLALCVILGITSWTSLCRLLRAETLKLREMDFIAAAISLGTPKAKILSRHILPNVMHIILITVVLDFSGLILAEAVLSYVGVGVDPTMISWGNMINSARMELAREPIVWWPLFAAFIFMFPFVLAANLFADAVRDAFDPRITSVERVENFRDGEECR